MEGSEKTVYEHVKFLIAWYFQKQITRRSQDYYALRRLINCISLEDIWKTVADEDVFVQELARLFYDWSYFCFKQPSHFKIPFYPPPFDFPTR